jgi:NitT/TauT family transport system substrate-binding protein
MINIRRALMALCLLACLGSGLGAALASSKDGAKVRFGVLPVLQALPIFVAQDRGMFSEAGVDVELIRFDAAADKDIALSSGGLDGCFADLATPAVLKGNDRDVVIVASNYDTRRDRRMFAVLGKPGGKYRSAADLANIPVAVSSNSVIHYVTEALLTSAGVAKDAVATLEAKNIGLRMQMLMSGQVEAATMPEPLVTAGLAKGAVLLGDDAGLGTSQTVLVFAVGFLKARPDAVKAFLAALNKAAKLINEQPDAVRPVMVEHVRLPEPLKATYPTPRFPEILAPDRESVQTIVNWLHQRGALRRAIAYDELVDASFVP